MAKKRNKRAKARGFSKFEKDVEKEIEEDVKEAEKWVIERRKFFIKLAWVVGLVIVLLIISHFFLRVKGT